MWITQSEVQYVEITDEWSEKLDRFREEHANDPEGDIANVVIFEDDRLRIWEMKLEPGECSDLHTHRHDYYLVILSGDIIAAVTPKGYPVDPFIGRVPENGNTVAIPKGGTEWAWNVGRKTYHEILIELKDT